MTSTRLTDGRIPHFPGPGAFVDSVGIVTALPDELPKLVPLIREDELLLFTRRLVDGARKRRFNDRYRDVNRSRLLFARLCIDRAPSGWAAKAPVVGEG
ncbi:hypothetical protein ACUSIJ_13405 [Pseudochelatococcus sp. B33]